MGIVDRAGIGKAVHIGMSKSRDDDLAECVVEVVLVVPGGTVVFGFVPPENDHSAVFVRLGRHDHRNKPAQGVVAQPNVGRIARQPGKACARSAVHLVVLVGRDPVVIGYAILHQIEG